MKSKNLIYLFILVFLVAAIIFLGEHGYVKAQNGYEYMKDQIIYESMDPGFSPYLSLYNPYNPSRFLESPALLQMSGINTSYAPLLAPLGIVPDLARTMMMTQTPGLVAMDWQQEKI